MDGNLREMGLSDMAVPRRMRRFGEAFYGRAVAYDAALDAAADGALAAALARNIFRQEDAAAPGAQRLATYVRAAEQGLARQPAAALAGGAPHFADPAVAAVAAAN
jgi:cytochrome b pre-mRNA-processing protein 3